MTPKPNKQGHRISGWVVGLLALLLVLLMIPMGLLISFSSSKALVVDSTPVGVDSAVNAKRIAKQLYRGLMRPPGQSSTILLSETELNGIVALATRGIDRLHGRTKISSSGLNADFTLGVPNNPFGGYINVSTHIVPSTDGLEVNKFAIGSLEIPGNWLISIVKLVLNRALEDEQLGSELLASVESVAISGSRLTLSYHAVADFRAKFGKLKKQLRYSRDDATLVKHYYQSLCNFHKTNGRGERVSFGAYLRHSFTDARQRSLTSEQSGAENKAALLALAIFLGSEKFDRLVGALDESLLRACQPAANQVMLENRIDLRLHFVFSAALKLLSNSGISFSIGEFKELLDSQRGNSGFSFADLAADRAGIRFAELAIDETGAVHVQDMAQQLASERLFFPLISGLPEGIDQYEFERRGGIESDYYKNHLAIIEARIDKLRLYQSLSGG